MSFGLIPLYLDFCECDIWGEILKFFHTFDFVVDDDMMIYNVCWCGFWNWKKNYYWVYQNRIDKK